jgi:hypothetical protein
MERLFPRLPGMSKYKKTLRGITRKSNELLLNVVEDLSYVYSDGRASRWDPSEVEENRKQVIEDLLAARDAFVIDHQDMMLATLERDANPIHMTEPARLAVSA